MLKRFSVSNYRGFKDKLIFDFSDVKRYTFNEYSIKNNLVNTGVIYGKNGTGKSNLGLAIFDLIVHLTDNRRGSIQSFSYLNGDSDEDAAHFVYHFVFNNIELKYEYKKEAVDKLVYEAFYIGEDKVFSYNFVSKLGDFSGLHLIGVESLKTDTVMNISVLRYITHNTNITKDNPVALVSDYVKRMLWIRSATDGNMFLGFKNNTDLLISTLIEEGGVQNFEKFLNRRGIKFKLAIEQDPAGVDSLIVLYRHKKYLFENIASHGTKVLFLYYVWMLKFKEASFVFIDEFDAFFHTELGAEMIVDLAKSQATQLIITTHNTNLMSNNILRPDCYFIMMKNKIKSLPNATERELREGHNLEKLYLAGAFDVR